MLLIYCKTTLNIDWKKGEIKPEKLFSQTNKSKKTPAREAGV